MNNSHQTISRARLLSSVSACIKWIESQMLSFDRGYWGIYERVRINLNQRVPWVRPDTNAEYTRLLMYYQKLTGDRSKSDVLKHISHWLLGSQNAAAEGEAAGSFNFFFIDGSITTTESGRIWQNDNGKILCCLTDVYTLSGDPAYLDAARRLADFWLSVQNGEGYYYAPGVRRLHNIAKGPCFLLWLMAGMYKMYRVTGERKYLNSGERALSYFDIQLISGGRILTSYQLEKTEDWRPYSSEIAIALLVSSETYAIIGDKRLKKTADEMYTMLSALQRDCGAVVNSNESEDVTSLNNDPDLADLVYTQGFALNAFISRYKTTGDADALAAAKSLAVFLMDIQCSGESRLWDGAWRGSYSISKVSWAGTCDQNNSIDEGGMYSVYAGWCCSNIAHGLLRLTECIDDKK